MFFFYVEEGRGEQQAALGLDQTERQTPDWTGWTGWTGAGLVARAPKCSSGAWVGLVEMSVSITKG